MNTHKNLVPIIVLAVLAALATVWLSSTGPAWAKSPISPVSPLPTHPVDTALHRCIIECSDTYGWEHTTWCEQQCMATMLPPRPLPPTVTPLPAQPKPDEPSVPTGTSAPVQSSCPSWWEELDPWMGFYTLRHHDGQYCIGDPIQ